MDQRPVYAAVLLVKDGGKHVLAGQKTFGSRDNNGRHFVTTIGGGKVEQGEDVINAAIREAEEETFHAISIDRKRLTNLHFHRGNTWDSYFWIYPLTPQETEGVSPAKLLSLYAEHVQRAQSATTVEERIQERRYTEFSHFFWLSIDIFKNAAGTVDQFTLFPPTMAALTNIPWDL